MSQPCLWKPAKPWGFRSAAAGAPVPAGAAASAGARARALKFSGLEVLGRSEREF